MEDLLKDRVAIVTGAGGGIGKAEAIGLASRGAKVISVLPMTAWEFRRTRPI